MQPTHARWEEVEDGDGDDNDEQPPNGIHRNSTEEVEQDEEKQSIFPKLKPFYPRNFMIHDIQMETAPNASANFEVSSDYENSKGFQSVPDDVLDELPPDCRIAL